MGRIEGGISFQDEGPATEKYGTSGEEGVVQGDTKK